MSFLLRHGCHGGSGTSSGRECDASQALVFVSQSAYQVGFVFQEESGQLEGEVQGGQTPEQEPQGVLGQDETKP
jgi:hypothetical protein